MFSRTRLPLDPDVDGGEDSSDTWRGDDEENTVEDISSIHNTNTIDLELQSQYSGGSRTPRDPSVIKVGLEEDNLDVDYKDQTASQAQFYNDTVTTEQRKESTSMHEHGQTVNSNAHAPCTKGYYHEQDPMKLGPDFKDQVRGASSATTATATTTATTTGAVFVSNRALHLRDHESSLPAAVQPVRGHSNDEAFLVSAVLVEPEATTHKSSSNRWRVVGCLLGSVMVGVAVVVGGICGSGLCSSKNVPSPSPVAPSAPTSTRTTLTFETTTELYSAIDEYVAVAGSATANVSSVAFRYGYPIGTWDVSKISDFSRAFDPYRTFDIRNCAECASTQSSFFNEDLSGWDTSSATTFFGMFAHASSFNGSIATWNTSSVTDMSFMFLYATNFSNDMSQWDVSRVTTMEKMFYNAQKFASNISGWNTGNVLSTFDMFLYAISFDSDLSLWDVSKVVTMRSMFWNAAKFSSDLSQWNVGNVVDMSWVFRDAVAFESDLSKWQVSKVTTMEAMFCNALSFSSDFATWDVSRVQDMELMFYRSSSTIEGISNWDVSKVQRMENMFGGAKVFNQDISTWDVSMVTDTRSMFLEASLFNQNLCEWGLRLPMTAIVDGMFASTACSDMSDPILPIGPFCEPCVFR